MEPETVESVVIAILGYKYRLAHEFATLAENRAVRAAGHDPKAYNAAQKPYINEDALERVTLIPRDIDLHRTHDTTSCAASVPSCGRRIGNARRGARSSIWRREAVGPIWANRPAFSGSNVRYLHERARGLLVELYP